MEKATGTGRRRVVLALAASILAHGAAAAVLAGWDRPAPGSPSIEVTPGEAIAVTVVLESPAEPAGAVAEAPAPPPPAETAVAEPIATTAETVATPAPPKPEIKTPPPKPAQAAASKPVRAKPERKAVETAALPPAMEVAPGPESPTPSEAPGPVEQPMGGPSEGGGAAALSPDYLADVLARLERHKRYPRQARLRREQGAVVLAFTIDRSGRVLAASIRRSSGSAALDAAATEMIERASPLPPLPVRTAQSEVEMVVPIRFALR